VKGKAAEGKTELIQWLLQHLPGGPEMHLDELPRIALSLEAHGIDFLRDLKAARIEVEKKQHASAN
jgi:hypothetical protein